MLLAWGWALAHRASAPARSAARPIPPVVFFRPFPIFLGRGPASLGKDPKGVDP